MKKETNNKIRGTNGSLKSGWLDLTDKNLEMLLKACSGLNRVTKSLDFRVEYKFPVDRELEGV